MLFLVIGWYVFLNFFELYEYNFGVKNYSFKVRKTNQKVGLFLMAVPQPFQFLGSSVWCIVPLFQNNVYSFFKNNSVSSYFVLNVLLLIVPLGSIPELPAESCKEIKASEGQQVVSDWYWIYSVIHGKAVLAYCDMETEGGVINWKIKLVQ